MIHVALNRSCTFFNKSFTDTNSSSLKLHLFFKNLHLPNLHILWFQPLVLGGVYDFHGLNFGHKKKETTSAYLRDPDPVGASEGFLRLVNLLVQQMLGSEVGMDSIYLGKL